MLIRSSIELKTAIKKNNLENHVSEMIDPLIAHAFIIIFYSCTRKSDERRVSFSVFKSPRHPVVVINGRFYQIDRNIVTSPKVTCRNASSSDVTSPKVKLVPTSLFRMMYIVYSLKMFIFNFVNVFLFLLIIG